MFAVVLHAIIVWNAGPKWRCCCCRNSVFDGIFSTRVDVLWLRRVKGGFFGRPCVYKVAVILILGVQDCWPFTCCSTCIPSSFCSAFLVWVGKVNHVTVHPEVSFLLVGFFSHPRVLTLFPRFSLTQHKSTWHFFCVYCTVENINVRVHPPGFFHIHKCFSLIQETLVS